MAAEFAVHQESKIPLAIRKIISPSQLKPRIGIADIAEHAVYFRSVWRRSTITAQQYLALGILLQRITINIPVLSSFRQL